MRSRILSALAEQPAIPPACLLDLPRLAIDDAHGTVPVGAAEILGRLVREAGSDASHGQARDLLRRLQTDPDPRVAAAALDSLQG